MVTPVEHFETNALHENYPRKAIDEPLSVVIAS